MTKPISSWSFEDKYDKLGEMEKMLHQVRLIRADVGSVVYMMAVLFFGLLTIICITIQNYRFAVISFIFSLLIILYGYYKHSEVRRKLYNRFEHQGAYI